MLPTRPHHHMVRLRVLDTGDCDAPPGLTSWARQHVMLRKNTPLSQRAFPWQHMHPHTNPTGPGEDTKLSSIPRLDTIHDSTAMIKGSQNTRSIESFGRLQKLLQNTA